MYTYELFPVEKGYGYDIFNDGSPCIHQDYMPDVDGFVVMTASEAMEWADIVVARLEG